jgi:hypothetical protein
MLSRLKIPLLSLLLLVGLTGCSLFGKKIVMYPITNQDFATIKKGEASPVDGYVMSGFYLEEVIKVKLENK